MGLCHIGHIGELHQILAIANVEFELALSGFGHKGGEEGGIPLPKDAAGPNCTGGQHTVGAIRPQNSLLALNLRAQASPDTPSHSISPQRDCGNVAGGREGGVCELDSLAAECTDDTCRLVLAAP